MQHGLPCIVSDATGTAAYINDGVDGFVVKAGDAVHLSDRLFWCITHPKELASMGKKARLVYERHFSMKVFEGNWLCMIRDIFKEIENDKDKKIFPCNACYQCGVIFNGFFVYGVYYGKRGKCGRGV